MNIKPLFLIISVSAIAAMNIGFIWAIIEFILLLAKDEPFNAWSLILMGSGTLVSFICLFQLYKNKYRKD